jgi:hypothetical protein
MFFLVYFVLPQAEASSDAGSGNENEDEVEQASERMGYEGDTDNQPFSEDKK